MAPHSPCPDVRELDRILRGLESDWDTERLARHLEGCTRCADAVDQFLDQETIVAALRGSSAPADPGEESTVRLLVHQMRGLRPAGQDSVGRPIATSSRADGSTVDKTPLPDSLAPPDGMDEMLRDLAPAEEPDEMGRLGSYGILRPLGSGGMGLVFAARQTQPRRIVALKMILAGPRGSRQRLARFHTETEIIARLQHPNIVPVYEAGEHQGRPYFTMEYAAGGNLAQKLAAAPLAARPAAELVAALARAVHFAHERGFIHRDLKPANILLAADGTPKITDFGLAKQIGEEAVGAAGPYRTESDAILGTPGYMAPEQAGLASPGRKPGESAVGPAADVYALGTILYECLTGRPPFMAASLLETLEQVRSQEPVPIARRRVPRQSGAVRAGPRVAQVWVLGATGTRSRALPWRYPILNQAVVFQVATGGIGAGPLAA